MMRHDDIHLLGQNYLIDSCMHILRFLVNLIILKQKDYFMYNLS